GGLGGGEVSGAAARGVAGVRRLRPRLARVEGEVHARDPDSRGERTRAGGELAAARLLVDLVVRACHHDVVVVGVDSNGRLVLLSLRGREPRTGARVVR